MRSPRTALRFPTWPVLAAVVALLAPAAAIASQDDLQRLAWLGGCWQSERGEPGSGEHWMPLAGGTLIGMSRTVRGGRTVDHEFMQVGNDAEGRLVYTAHPSGQRTTAFVLLRITDTEAVFENLQHDFPQRVAYRQHAPDRLVARIEGLRQGTLKVIEFPMRRGACDAVGDTARHAPRDTPPDATPAKPGP